MEEKKLKPFNLEAAKAGAPVVTRDGYPVKIYDFELNNKYPLFGIIMYPDRDEGNLWTKDGCYSSSGECSSYDLFMATIKKEGWVNIYSNSYYVGYAGNIYKTKEEALDNNSQQEYVDTVKIEWEE